MKTHRLATLILFALILLCACFAQAVPPLPVASSTGRISLQWDASTTPGVRYRLYHSTNNLTWTTTYTVTGTAHTVSNVPAGSLNWFMVRAVNDDGIESDPSNVYEKAIAPKPAPPGNLMAIPIEVSLRTRSADGEWTVIRTYTDNVLVSSTEPHRQFQSEVKAAPPMALTPIR